VGCGEPGRRRRMGGRAAAAKQVRLAGSGLAAKVGDSCTRGLGKESAQVSFLSKKKKKKGGGVVRYLSCFNVFALIGRLHCDHIQPRLRSVAFLLMIANRENEKNKVK
jgi:hypothetical protein